MEFSYICGLLVLFVTLGIIVAALMQMYSLMKMLVVALIFLCCGVAMGDLL